MPTSEHLHDQAGQLLSIATAAKLGGAERRSMSVDYLIRFAQDTLDYLDEQAEGPDGHGYSRKVGSALDEDALESMKEDLDLPDDPADLPQAVASVLGAMGTEDGRAAVGFAILTEDGQQFGFRLGLSGLALLLDGIDAAAQTAATETLRRLYERLGGDRG